MFRLLGAALVAAFFAPIAPKAKAQEDYLGRIVVVPYNFCPRNTLPAEGQWLNIREYSPLFALMGTSFGGDGRTTFALPDLRGRVILSQGRQGDKVYAVGDVVQINEGSETQGLVLQSCIVIQGSFPTRN